MARGTAFDGTYQGTLNYTANVPGQGTVSGSAPIGLTVSGGSVSGSFGPVPQYGTVSFSGSASSSGSATAGAAYGCTLSMQFTSPDSSAGVSGSITGCTDQGGTASGTFTATRVSAPPAAPPPTSTPPASPPPASTPPASTPPAAAATVHAQLETGQATVVHRDGSTEAVGKTIELQAGDTVKTGKNGRLVLAFDNGAKLTLSPNSTFELGAVGKRVVDYKQLLGEILYSLVSGKRRYRVTTTNACACVRGTVFSVKTRPGWTRVRVRKGAVDFYNVRRKAKHVLVRAGFESVVSGSRAPTAPRRF